MIKKEYSGTLLLTNDLIGGKWKLRVLWHIIHGANRFSLLVKAIPDISQKVLASQLKELEHSGILKRDVVDNHPPKVVVYGIADEHLELIPIINDMWSYTKKYAKKRAISIAD